MRVINRFVSLTEMILYFDKLGQMSFIEFSWLLINCGRVLDVVSMETDLILDGHYI